MFIAAKEKEQEHYEITEGVDSSGQTVLFDEFCPSDKIIAYVQEGANVNARDFKGQTPLHAHVRMGQVDITNALIYSGADVNARDLQERTPLFFARDPQVADILVRSGADVNAVNKDGETVLTYIMNAQQDPNLSPLEQKNLRDICECLRAVGASEECPEAGVEQGSQNPEMQG